MRIPAGNGLEEKHTRIEGSCTARRRRSLDGFFLPQSFPATRNAKKKRVGEDREDTIEEATNGKDVKGKRLNAHGRGRESERVREVRGFIGLNPINLTSKLTLILKISNCFDTIFHSLSSSFVKTFKYVRSIRFQPTRVTFLRDEIYLASGSAHR